MTERLRVGLVGYGLSGRIFHAPFVATNPRFDLRVISTGDPVRQEQARARHPRAEIVGTPGELLDRGLDLVILASPPQAHLEQGLAALAAGASVVVDKPFTPSVVEAEQLIAAASDAQLFVYQNRRWDGDFRTVRGLVESGALGTVHRFASTFERWSPALRDRWQDTAATARGAGISFDLGSHLVDQALQLFGPAVVTSAELSVLRHGGVSDDEAFLSLLHENGVRSHLTMSRFAGQNAPRFRVLGSASAYTSSGLDGQEPALMAGGSPTDPGFGQTPSERWGLLGIGTQVEPVPMARGEYAAFYAGVAATLLDGAVTPVDPLSALATLAIIERAHELTGI